MKKQDWLAGMLMAGALLVGCENVEEPEVDTVVEQEVQEEEVDNQAQEEVEKLQKLQQEAVAMQDEIETLRKALDEERAKAPAVEVKKEVEYVYVPKTEYVYIPKTEYVEVEKEVIKEVPVEVEKPIDKEEKPKQEAPKEDVGQEDKEIPQFPTEEDMNTPKPPLDKEPIQEPQQPEVQIPEQEQQQQQVTLNKPIQVKGNGEDLFEIIIKDVSFIEDPDGVFESIAVVTVEGTNIGQQGKHPLNEYLFNAYDENGTVLDIQDVYLEENGWLYDYEFIGEGRNCTSIIPYGVNGNVFELEVVEDIYYGEIIGSLFVTVEKPAEPEQPKEEIQKPQQPEVNEPEIELPIEPSVPQEPEQPQQPEVNEPVEPEVPEVPEQPEVIVPPVVEPEQPQEPQEPEVPEVIEPEIPETPQVPSQPEIPQEQLQANQEAQTYVDVTAVSEKALLQILTEIHGYSTDVAQKAIASLNVNWHEEAKQAAQEYIDSRVGISYKNLIQVLQTADQFTSEQAQAAVDAIRNNVNWRVQCLYAARRYLNEAPGTDRETVRGLLLCAEHFTPDEINFASSQIWR